MVSCTSEMGSPKSSTEQAPQPGLAATVPSLTHSETGVAEGTVARLQAGQLTGRAKAAWQKVSGPPHASSAAPETQAHQFLI